MSAEENIDILLSRQTMAIDLVRMRSDRIRYFVNVSAGGFSGLVDEKLTPTIKRTWGPLAYVRSAAAALPELHGYRTKIVIDDTERMSIDLCNAIVGNGRFVGGGLPVAPNANPSDGLLDVILISKRSKTEMVSLATQILLGKHLSSEAIIFRRAKKVSICSKPGMCFNADGELVGNKPAVFEVIRRALHFVVREKMKKIVTLDELGPHYAKQLRATGKKLVATNGCFDLLHAGHIRYLQAARALGDALAVGLNGDRSVRELKGPGRPINNEKDRAEVLAALEHVDLVSIFPEMRGTRFLEMVAPAIYVKGGDYTSETLNAEERAILEKIGRGDKVRSVRTRLFYVRSAGTTAEFA